MLIEFKVSNYRSIGNEQVLSLVPAPKQKDFLDNILISGNHESLNAIAIYGANGSGKSNLLSAMGVLDKMIHLSSRWSSTTKLPFDPFLLREGWTAKPTTFEITFIIKEDKYRYGIQYSQESIEKEWLFRKGIGREVLIFLREGEIIDPSSALKAGAKVIDAAIEATKPNGLFLSSCDMLNINEAKKIMQWFRNFNIVDGIDTAEQEIRTVNMWQETEFRNRILEYMIRMGTGISGIEIETQDFDEKELPTHLNDSTRQMLIQKLTGSQSFKILASHFIYDLEGNPTKDQVSWQFEDRESNGTNKALQLSGPLLWALKNGGVLIIDEIEAKLHPIMTLDMINMFLDKNLNINSAQLIFATHDTNLLSYAELRRDQIYFTEKNNWESTEIYSLSDFTYVGKTSGSTAKERPDTDKEKRYFEGRYGAVPMLGHFKIFNTSN